MWTLWFIPLVTLALILGVVGGIIFLAVGGWRKPRNWLVVIGAPLGCAALPLGGLGLLALIGSMTKVTDAEIFEEVFGYRPTMSEDRMLIDDFGSGDDREIYLRAEVTQVEWQRLRKIPGMKPSRLSIDDIEAMGSIKGFMWWIDRKEGGWPEYRACGDHQITEAPGFRKWTQLIIVHCRLSEEHSYGQLGHTDKVYVAAKRSRRFVAARPPP